MRRPYKQLLLLLVVLLQALSTNASELQVTSVLYHFNYQEFDQENRLIDKEEGFLPGLEASYIYPVDTGTLTTDLAFFGGSVDYDLYSQNISIHRTETEQKIYRLGISYLKSNDSEFLGQLFVALHYWRWDRDILTRNGVQGLHELYSWYEAELGMRFQSSADQDSGYWLNLSVLYTFNPEMKLFLPSSKERFDLVSHPGFRIRAGTSWHLKPELKASISLFAEYWEFGRSNTVFTDDFYGNSGFLTEPMSESFHTGLEISLNFQI